MWYYTSIGGSVEAELWRDVYGEIGNKQNETIYAYIPSELRYLNKPVTLSMPPLTLKTPYKVGPLVIPILLRR